jgi:putative DNA primase/helicase
MRDLHISACNEWLPIFSRMADFERWVTAAEPELGFKPGIFLRAYRKNQNSANELALEASPIADAIISRQND